MVNASNDVNLAGGAAKEFTETLKQLSQVSHDSSSLSKCLRKVDYICSFECMVHVVTGRFSDAGGLCRSNEAIQDARCKMNGARKAPRVAKSSLGLR